MGGEPRKHINQLEKVQMRKSVYSQLQASCGHSVNLNATEVHCLLFLASKGAALLVCSLPMKSKKKKNPPHVIYTSATHARRA